MKKSASENALKGHVRCPTGIFRSVARSLYLHPSGKLYQDGWLRPACFEPSHFCKEGFQKDEKVLVSKKHSFFIIFSNFSNVE